MTLLDDAELRLPKRLVYSACVEMQRHGMILCDTAALLIEHGADMHRLTEQVWEQSRRLELEPA